MFKIETHLHTAETSGCAHLKAKDMIKLYHEAGYNTIFVTDHLNSVFFEKYGPIPWEEKVTLFLNGYYRARVVGERLGVNVILAAELALKTAPHNHYLLYGIDRNFLDTQRDIFDCTIEEFMQIAKKYNIFVVQAHPYRDESSTPTPECVDAIEVFNANPRHDDYSEKSLQLAQEYHLPMTAGSDSHRVEDVGRGGILSEHEIKTVEDYVALIQSGKAQIYRGN